MKSLRTMIVCAIAATSPLAWGQGAETDQLRAQIAEVVAGEPGVWLERLQQAKKTARGNKKHEVEAQLAACLQKLGRQDEARASLRSLEGAPEPYGSWARNQLQEAESGQESTDPVGRLVETLGRGFSSERTGLVRSAELQLRGLGALANPYLLDALEKIGPFGFKNAVSLLARTMDDSVQQRFRAIIERGDEAQTLVIAEALSEMEAGARASLGRLLLKSPHESVSVAAAVRLSDNEPNSEVGAMARGILLKGLASSSAELRRDALMGLPGRCFDGTEERESRILAGLRDQDARVRSAAAHLWIKSPELSSDAQGVALSKEELSLELKGAIKDDWSSRERPQTFLRFLRFPGVDDGGVREILGAVNPARVKISEDDLTYFCGHHLERSDVRQWIERYVGEHDLVVPLQTLLGLLQSSPSGGSYFSLIPLLWRDYPTEAAELGPQDVGARWQEHLELLAERASPAGVTRVLDALEGTQNRRLSGSGSRPAIQKVIARRSTPAHLERLLDLDRRTSGSQGETTAKSIGEAISSWYSPELIERTASVTLDTQPPIAQAILGGMRQYATEAHVPVLLALAQRCVADWKTTSNPDVMPTGTVGTTVMYLLSGKFGANAQVAKAFDDWMTHPSIEVRNAAWRTRAAFATADDKALFELGLSESASHRVFETALGHPVTVGDEHLRGLALKALETRDITPNARPVADAVKNLMASVDTEVLVEYLFRVIPGWSRAGSHENVLIPLLRQLGAARAVRLIPPLKLAMGHPSITVRETAVSQMGRTFSADAMEALIQALRDEHPSVRKAAKERLEAISEYLDEKSKWEDRLKKAKLGK